jgi:hypothetical protein
MRPIFEELPGLVAVRYLMPGKSRKSPSDTFILETAEKNYEKDEK